jgi:hypothetical protein
MGSAARGQSGRLGKYCFTAAGTCAGAGGGGRGEERKKYRPAVATQAKGSIDLNFEFLCVLCVSAVKNFVGLAEALESCDAFIQANSLGP